MKLHAQVIFLEELTQRNIFLSENQIQQFYDYYELLLQWNKCMNLTAITEVDEIYIKHFFDSVMCSQFIPFQEGISLIDVGCGAGFPGVPLKIVFPHIKLTLLDALRKRIEFLNDLCTKLDLNDMDILHGRAETFGRNENYRNRYDYVVSRAVAPLQILVEYCLPFLHKDGIFICLKGPGVHDEIKDAANAINILGGTVENIFEVKLPVHGEDRSIILVRKIKETPSQYPRREGIPKKRPLK